MLPKIFYSFEANKEQQEEAPKRLKITSNNFSNCSQGISNRHISVSVLNNEPKTSVREKLNVFMLCEYSDSITIYKQKVIHKPHFALNHLNIFAAKPI